VIDVDGASLSSEEQHMRSCAPQQVDREVYHGNKGEEIVLPDPL
jgi:hypothetical protein